MPINFLTPFSLLLVLLITMIGGLMYLYPGGISIEFEIEKDERPVSKMYKIASFLAGILMGIVIYLMIATLFDFDPRFWKVG